MRPPDWATFGIPNGDMWFCGHVFAWSGWVWQGGEFGQSVKINGGEFGSLKFWWRRSIKYTYFLYNCHSWGLSYKIWHLKVLQSRVGSSCGVNVVDWRTSCFVGVSLAPYSVKKTGVSLAGVGCQSHPDKMAALPVSNIYVVWRLSVVLQCFLVLYPVGWTSIVIVIKQICVCCQFLSKKV